MPALTERAYERLELAEQERPEYAHGFALVVVVGEEDQHEQCTPQRGDLVVRGTIQIVDGGFDEKHLGDRFLGLGVRDGVWGIATAFALFDS